VRAVDRRNESSTPNKSFPLIPRYSKTAIRRFHLHATIHYGGYRTEGLLDVVHHQARKWSTLIPFFLRSAALTPNPSPACGRDLSRPLSARIVPMNRSKVAGGLKRMQRCRIALWCVIARGRDWRWQTTQGLFGERRCFPLGRFVFPLFCQA
jgi:hypothetical protein